MKSVMRDLRCGTQIVSSRPRWIDEILSRALPFSRAIRASVTSTRYLILLPANTSVTPDSTAMSWKVFSASKSDPL